MKNRRVYCLNVILFLLFTRIAIAQNTVAIPDANFRTFLQTNYPAVMSGALLDTLASAGVGGNFNCRNKGISNIYGLQFFKNVISININNNVIVSLPNLVNMNNLMQLHCDTNLLTTLPSFSLPSLVILSCKHNLITSISSFAGTPALLNLGLSNNQLTTLPSIGSMPNITTFDVAENQLTSLPSFSAQNNLENVYCGKNQLTVLPDFTTNLNLRMLYCNDNLLTTLPALNQCTLLQALNCGGNQLNSIQSLSFISSPILVVLKENYLTFEDLIPVVNNANYSLPKFTLFPQKKIGTYNDTTQVKSSAFQFNLSFDASVSGNTYSWYKKGVYLTSTTVNTLTVPTITSADSGTYYCVVKNSNPNFSTSSDSLISNARILKIVSCFEYGSKLTYSSQVISCEKGYQVTLDASQVIGGKVPYTYLLTNTVTNQTLESTSTSFSNIKIGAYSVSVRDQDGCEFTPVNFELSPTADCDPVFSPNGDGVSDLYFINISGKANVFDKTGKLIREFNSPAYWDGTDKSGKDVPSGFYAIIVNDRITMYVSLIR